MEKKTIAIAGLCTICIVGLVALGIVMLDSTKEDKPMLKRGKVKNAEHVITNQLENNGFRVSEDVRKKATKVTESTKKELKKSLKDRGLPEKKSTNLSEAMALMGMSYGQISDSKITEVDQEGTGIMTTLVETEIKGKKHEFQVFFDYDDNKTILSIYDENDELLYGYEDDNILIVRNVNQYYS